VKSEILLAQPRGFCAGVKRAIEIVELALIEFGAPIYVRHEIVHNSYVVNALRHKGAIFIDELQDVPRGSTVIFSAHGVSRAVQAEAVALGLRVFDATCPLVSRVHKKIELMSSEGYEIIMIGHAGHPEVVGTMGHASIGMHLVETVLDVEQLQVKNPGMLAYVSQTTLSVDETAEIIYALKCKYPNISSPKTSDICYATTNRQEAVKFMAPQVNLVIVVGSPNSSNSNRLREVAEKIGVLTYMVDAATQIDPAWLIGKKFIGVTAGASVPEDLVQAVIEKLKECGAGLVRTLDGTEEHVTFLLPKELCKPHSAENACLVCSK